MHPTDDAAQPHYQCVSQLCENSGQLLLGNVEQGGVRENTVERGRRQRELQKILVPHRTAGVLSRHLAERRAPVQPDRRVAQFSEVEKIPAGTAAQVEQAKPRFFGQRV